MPQDENKKPAKELQVKKPFQTAHDVFAADTDLLHRVLDLHAHQQVWHLEINEEERQELYECHYRDGFQRIAQRIAIIELGLSRTKSEYKDSLARYNEYGSFEARQKAKLLRDDTDSFYQRAKEGTLIPDLSAEALEKWWDEWNPDENDIEPNP